MSFTRIAGSIILIRPAALRPIVSALAKYQGIECPRHRGERLSIPTFRPVTEVPMVLNASFN
jgi:hypothetical protein